MFRWFKRLRCKEHNFEIVARGYVKQGRYSCWYYKVTTATCIKCGHKKELDRKELINSKPGDGQLIKVYRDPQDLYDWFIGEEVADALTKN